MKSLFIIILFAVFCGFFTDIFAVEVKINDTTTKSDIVILPVLGNTDDILNKKVEFIFELNWVQFELLDILSSNDYAINNNVVSYSYDWQTRLLKVSCNNIVASSIGRLFDIKLRLLPRMDFFADNNTFQITPKQVLVTDNDGSITTFDLTSATASVQLDTIASNQTFYESVSYNYPNPFNYETTVFFSINEATPVAFYLYKTDGTLVQTSPDDNYADNCLNYKIYNSNNEEVVSMDKNWKDYEFKQGLYKIVFTVDRGNISLDNYTLVLKTNKNSYTLNIIYSN